MTYDLDVTAESDLDKGAYRYTIIAVEPPAENRAVAWGRAPTARDAYLRGVDVVQQRVQDAKEVYLGRHALVTNA